MRFVALAVDYDGTLATAGEVAPATVLALERLAASGRKLILVTGRELDELLAIFPAIAVFDRVVAENGALLYTPATGQRRELAGPPPPPFVRELLRRQVAPLSVGKTIVATVHPNETVVLEAIRDLGLELQVIFNKGAVMVLPASVNKASGLRAALDELALSLRNCAAIGDAENDHALLRAAEYGVAVANAVPMLQREADRVSAAVNGAAVIELASDLVAHDLAATPPRAPRRAIALGVRADGAPARIPPAGTNLLVAGAAGSVRNDFVTGMLQRLAADGYQFCLFDPEGDHATLANAVVFGDGAHVPGEAEVITALEKPAVSVVMNLCALPLPERLKVFHAMLQRLEAMRAKRGRPHWVVIDEAHRLLPHELAAGVSPEALVGAVLVTARPTAVAPAVLRAMNTVLAVGESAGEMLREFGRGIGLDRLEAHDAPGPGEALLWSRDARDRVEAVQLAHPRAANAASVTLPATNEGPA